MYMCVVLGIYLVLCTLNPNSMIEINLHQNYDLRIIVQIPI